MSMAASVEKSQMTRLLAREEPTWRRAVTIAGLVMSDLLCFACADLLLHTFSTPPALAMFRGNVAGKFNMVVDLVLLISIIFICVRYIAGDYSRRQLFWDGARTTTGALLIGGCVYLLAVLALDPSHFLLSAFVWIGLVFALPTMRQVMRSLLGRIGCWHWPTAIVGTNETAQEVYPVLRRQLALGLDVRWVVPESPDSFVPKSMAGLVVVHAAPEDLTTVLQRAGCRQVILVPDDRSSVNPSDIIDLLVAAGMGVAIVPSLRRLPLFGLSTSNFFGKDLLLLQVRNNLARLPQRILKRGLDLALSMILVLLLSPVLVTFALMIKLEDGGPVFFRQHRVGRWQRDFSCWKFRTMVVDAEAQMARWSQENPVLLARYRESNFKLAGDPRVTRAGKWMRRLSLDELPQLFNVLLGDMSLVGPRPLLRRELPDYGAAIMLYQRVRPGITGMWQISGRSHTTFSERVYYDEWYIKNWTVWYDVVIMLQTFWAVSRSKGAY